MDIRFSEVVSLAFSSTALFFTFRKDAHRISLEVTPLWEQWIDVLGVSNDSSFPVGILSVAHFDETGRVKWLSVGDYVKNQWAQYPIRIEPRSLASLQVLVVKHIGDHQRPHGYCVQLESGRVFIVKHTAPFWPTWKLHFASVLSRLSAGRIAPWLSRPRLPNQA
jgi:hypothetical protein